MFFNTFNMVNQKDENYIIDIDYIVLPTGFAMDFIHGVYNILYNIFTESTEHRYRLHCSPYLICKGVHISFIKYTYSSLIPVL